MATTKTKARPAPPAGQPAIRPLPQDQKRPRGLKRRVSRALPMLVACVVLVVLVVLVAVTDVKNPVGYTAFMTQGISMRRPR